LCAALAACAAEGSTHIGGACAEHNICDSGQICDLTDPSGKPVCVDANGDMDGDGIPNGKDYCQHMAGGAFDEDGDGIGDDCDKCPIKKPAASADSDGDAVDGPCDPDTRTGGEQIVLFNGFNAPPPAAWTMPPTYQIVGGEAVMTPIDGDPQEISIPLPSASTHMVLFTSYLVDAVDIANAEAAVVGRNVIPMGAYEVVCGGLRQGGLDQLELNTDGGPHAMVLKDVFGGNAYELAVQLDGTTANCAFVNGATGSGALTAQDTGQMIDRVILRARSAKLHFRYVLVLKH
jgi:hypothetical protein